MAGEAKTLGGTVEITASFRYEPAEFAFYLDRARIVDLKIQGVPEEWTGLVEKVSLDRLSTVFQKYPIYTIEATSAKKSITKMVLRDVTVVNGELVITLGI